MEWTQSAGERNLRARSLLIGDDEHIIPMASSVRAAKELPNARLVVIPGCGHAPREECPALFLRAANEFLMVWL
jgi:3-oxoadipate enol-lactonase